MSSNKVQMRDGDAILLMVKVMGITSKYFYDFHLPSPPDVNAAIKEVFR